MTTTNPSSLASYQHSTCPLSVNVLHDDDEQAPQQTRRFVVMGHAKVLAFAFAFLTVASSTRLVFSGQNTMAALFSTPQIRPSCRPPPSVIVDSNGIIDNGPGSDGSCNGTAHWYRDQLVDHFLGDNDEREASSNKWSQKYFFNDDYFRGPGYPIFYIMGGEDQADCLFYPFVTHNLARIFGGMTLEAEHRFYGQSQPIQNSEDNVQGMVGLLTVEQTMEDFLRLRTDTKMQNVWVELHYG